MNDARRLVLNEHLDAASTAFNLGYESPSQISCEYSRLFGAPPKRDIEGMRSRVGKAAPRLERAKRAAAGLQPLDLRLE
jgi:AraC-like DNA-binding protein